MVMPLRRDWRFINQVMTMLPRCLWCLWWLRYQWWLWWRSSPWEWGLEDHQASDYGNFGNNDELIFPSLGPDKSAVWAHCGEYSCKQGDISTSFFYPLWSTICESNSLVNKLWIESKLSDENLYGGWKPGVRVVHVTFQEWAGWKRNTGTLLWNWLPRWKRNTGTWF